MIVVSDTSAITSLIQVNRVEVLSRLYGEICIPEAVQKELLRTHAILPEFVRVRPTEKKVDVQHGDRLASRTLQGASVFD